MTAASRDAQVSDVLAANQRLLESIATADWNAYAALCDAEMSCFEPEARGELVMGLAFHKYYFDLGPSRTPRGTTMCSPHVHLAGDMAVVCYVRLTQAIDAAGAPHTSRTEETRVWRKTPGGWKHVHFHRSANG